MCGIAGVSHLTDVTRAMLPYLAWDIESRGRDSWGATNGTSTSKHLGPITCSMWDSMEEILSWDRCILHTRAASCGAVTIPNAHPFQYKLHQSDGTLTRRVMGIHNGIVVNHIALDNRYHRDFEVDSMHIFAHLAEGRAMSDIHGWGNIAWYEFDEDFPDGCLRVLRFNNDALHIAKLVTGELVFCSTKDTIIRAAAMAGSDVKKFLTTSEDTVYRLGQDRDGEWQFFKREPKMLFGTRVEPFVRQFPDADFQRVYEAHRHTFHEPSRYGEKPPTLATIHFEDRKKDICLINGCLRKVTPNRRNSLVCEEDWKLISSGVGQGVGV